ncbi:DUF4837 family protein [candidate division KSB1 bacterium]
MSRISKLLIISSMLLVGCDQKMPSLGEWNNIVVFSDDETWNDIGQTMRNVFERHLFTPQDETVFNIYRPQFDDFISYQRRRFVILAGTLDSQSQVSMYIGQIISPEVRQAIIAGEHIFSRENEWANNQAVIFLIAPTQEELHNSIMNNEEKLFRLIDESRNKYVEELMFAEAEQVEVAKQLFEDYNFTLRVQHDYILKEAPEEKYIMLRRVKPDRLITVCWIDTTGVETVSGGWAFDKRNELGSLIIENKAINAPYTTVKNTTFLDYFAVEIRGLWIDNVENIGGPLVNYTFYDERTGRIYMIDLLIFAPDLAAEKEPVIRQLEIIAKTFSTTLPDNVQ